ncbi:type VI secretion system membrane subunit TssM [Pseudomonas juntendi]|uniref:Type VI secretion system membrane subunit TssM n=1 Tax=Pseudomonas juntendi TaxID=2666183 RepID=A0ABD4YDL6_9PSED|nr:MULTISPECIES: type VI secretion system membrane subunit TssM [Pseudomonas]MDG9873997.1 type VI secretion system membrane subunit TssM [Pseudomonas juntendi]MDH0757581.1 type VI secretion system membrane subunit TssM [Pseudomonas juntendi]MDH1920293.1 type VI secretion system membrane subunit TssM [Pseudomonas juntendi]RRV72226.1 type VI secretion system membrane subunit TssM [Pseudomonas sp. p99-361]SUD78315.1 OmpA/MotB domain-containing protein [Pseudomonas putida]
MNKIKYYCLRYQPYLLGVAFFLVIFLVWAIGSALGFASLHSLLAGIGAFLLLSAGYVLLLYRGAGQHHNLEGLLRDDADQAVLNATPADREEVSLLRERLLQGIERLHKNTPRGTSAKDALYALPWYLVIGQPAAGKSTMILQSGLNFPYAEREGARVAGLGGTRNCDWFFSSEAVLLDTAGRYMNSPEEAGKWRGFLQLLRQHRQRRPLNGLIVSVSIADVVHGSAEDQQRVAKRLRERIQESCALLEVRLPIYLVFTKCDLIPGFTPFYRQLDEAARGEVMGKTFAHKGYEQADWGQRFGQAMDDLTRYWQQVASQQLVQQDIQVTRQNDAAYRFPLELAAIKPRLQAFVDSLLRANPYQNAEMLRGFYFTAALQADEALWGSHGQHVAERFALEYGEGAVSAGSQPAPLFINSLFRKVIIPDQHLVALYTSNHRERRRKAAWVACASLAGLVLCSLWGWSYLNNRAVLGSIASELAEAKRQDQAAAGQYAAWRSLDRLRFWAAHYYRQHREQGVPFSLRLGLYQGHQVEPLLRDRYFTTLQQVMLKPTADNLTRTLYLLTTLKVYQRNTRELQPVSGVDSVEAEALPHDNRAQSIADFGKATLDTYVMLSPAQREKADPAFLKAHLPDYWYPAIARHTGHSLSEANQGKGDQDYLYASRQITFYADQIRETDVPRILDNAFLISSSRNYIDSLRAQSLRAIETITLESDTLFAFGRADFQSLKSEGQNQLSAIASKLLNTPNIGKIVISGHADQLGDSQSNLQVSKQRAQTIRTYLVGKGVPAELVVAQGEGSRKPLVNCDMQQARAQLIKCLEPNRRVEIEVRGLN